MKYLGVNITNPATYPENYKILIKKTKEDQNKWKDIPC